MKDQRLRFPALFYGCLLFLMVFVLCSCQLGKDEYQFTSLDEKQLSVSEPPKEVVEKETEPEENDEKIENTRNEEKTEEKISPSPKKGKEEVKREKTSEKKDDSPKDPEKKKTENPEKSEKPSRTGAPEKKPEKKIPEKKKEIKVSPVPEEKKEQTKKQEEKKTCTISIECSTILAHAGDLNPKKRSFVPEDGKILEKKEVNIENGDSVYDILYRVCRENNIHFESKYTPAYGTYYVEGIHQLYEFDCGNLSGWLYLVNGKQPNYGCSNYQVSEGDSITWSYTCDAGKDIGG